MHKFTLVRVRHARLPAAHHRSLLSFAVPPSYEECYSGKVHIGDEQDTEFTRGDMRWAPCYPFYRQLSVDALALHAVK